MKEIILNQIPEIQEIKYNEYEYLVNYNNNKVLFNDASKTNTHLMAIENNDNLLRFKLLDAAPNQTIINNNIITYPNAFESVDLQYTILEDKVKEVLIINSSSAKHDFNFSTLEQNIISSFNEDGSIDYKDELNNTLWSIEAPYAYDANNNELEVIMTNNLSNYTLEVITDENTQYPIYLDPTVYASVNINMGIITESRMSDPDTKTSYFDLQGLKIGKIALRGVAGTAARGTFNIYTVLNGTEKLINTTVCNRGMTQFIDLDLKLEEYDKLKIETTKSITASTSYLTLYVTSITIDDSIDANVYFFNSASTTTQLLYSSKTYFKADFDANKFILMPCRSSVGSLSGTSTVKFDFNGYDIDKLLLSNGRVSESYIYPSDDIKISKGCPDKPLNTVNLSNNSYKFASQYNAKLHNALRDSDRKGFYLIVINITTTSEEIPVDIILDTKKQNTVSNSNTIDTNRPTLISTNITINTNKSIVTDIISISDTQKLLIANITTKIDTIISISKLYEFKPNIIRRIAANNLFNSDSYRNTFINIDLSINTNRPIFSNTSILSNTNRTINIPIVSKLDTFKYTTVSSNLSLDTNKSIIDTISYKLDTHRGLLFNLSESIDITRRITKTISFKVNSIRNILLNMSKSILTIRTIHLKINKNIDSIRRSFAPILILNDTNIEKVVSVNINSKTSRELNRKEKVLVNSIRKLEIKKDLGLKTNRRTVINSEINLNTNRKTIFRNKVTYPTNKYVNEYFFLNQTNTSKDFSETTTFDPIKAGFNIIGFTHRPLNVFGEMVVDYYNNQTIVYPIQEKYTDYDVFLENNYIGSRYSGSGVKNSNAIIRLYAIYTDKKISNYKQDTPISYSEDKKYIEKVTIHHHGNGATGTDGSYPMLFEYLDKICLFNKSTNAYIKEVTLPHILDATKYNWKPFNRNLNFSEQILVLESNVNDFINVNLSLDSNRVIINKITINNKLDTNRSLIASNSFVLDSNRLNSISTKLLINSSRDLIIDHLLRNDSKRALNAFENININTNRLKCNIEQMRASSIRTIIKEEEILIKTRRGIKEEEEIEIELNTNRQLIANKCSNLDSKREINKNDNIVIDTNRKLYEPFKINIKVDTNREIMNVYINPILATLQAYGYNKTGASVASRFTVDIDFDKAKFKIFKTKYSVSITDKVVGRIDIGNATHTSNVTDQYVNTSSTMSKLSIRGSIAIPITGTGSTGANISIKELYTNKEILAERKTNLWEEVTFKITKTTPVTIDGATILYDYYVNENYTDFGPAEIAYPSIIKLNGKNTSLPCKVKKDDVIIVPVRKYGNKTVLLALADSTIATSIKIDTNREVIKNNTNIILDTNRNIFKTNNIELKLDTNRISNISTNLNIKTLRRSSIYNELIADTIKPIRKHIDIYIDTNRIHDSKIAINIKLDTNRKAKKDINVLIESIRKISAPIQINLDTIKPIRNEIELKLDTNREVNKLIKVELKIDTNRKTYFELIANMNINTNRNITKDTKINLDTNRINIIKENNIKLDTKREVIYEVLMINKIDTNREVIKTINIKLDIKREISEEEIVLIDTFKRITRGLIYNIDTEREIIKQTVFNYDSKRTVYKPISDLIVTLEIDLELNKNKLIFIDTKYKNVLNFKLTEIKL